MTKELRAVAEAIGTAWGEQEAELWRDWHDQSEKPTPAWTMGTYAGRIPGPAELRDEVEYVIDCAARTAWNRKLAEVSRG